MEFIIENVTNEETKILEEEGIEWWVDDINSRDVLIVGDVLYYEMVLHALKRM